MLAWIESLLDDATNHPAGFVVFMWVVIFIGAIVGLLVFPR